MDFSKNRLTFLNKASKQASNFGYTDIQNINNHDYQCFTDSYIAVYLYEHDESLPLFRTVPAEQQKKGYPKIAKLIENKELEEVATITYTEINKLIKENQSVKCKDKRKALIACKFNEAEFSPIFNLYRIKELYNLIGTRKLTFYIKDDFEINLTNLLYCKDENNNIAILCGLGCLKDIKCITLKRK